jgi:hypothetical protein
MIARFYDRQNTSNPLNGLPVSRERPLADALESAFDRKPFFCELVGENGYNLLVGVGVRCGCVQYSKVDGGPPYLMALPKGSPLDEQGSGYMEFVTGDTAAPVSRRYCLTIGTVVDVAAYFCKAGERSQEVTWEEI